MKNFLKKKVVRPYKKVSKYFGEKYKWVKKRLFGKLCQCKD